MDEASLSPEIQKLYRAFLIANQTTEEEVPVEMFMQIMQQQGGGQGEQQGPMMAAHGGRVHAKRGIYLGPDDELEDDDRYDEELLEILGDEGAMFHADYDVADEWKKGGHINRPGYAPGGIADLDLRGGGHSIGPGTGTSDDIPAMLSDGEFVVTAQAVENLGGGDRMEGARRMYSMMNQLDPQSQAPAEMNYVGRG